MNYKLTIRRRLTNGGLQTATYKLEHLHSTGDDEEQAKLLFDLELQANGYVQLGNVDKMPNVRAWVEEVD